MQKIHFVNDGPDMFHLGESFVCWFYSVSTLLLMLRAALLVEECLA